MSIRIPDRYLEGVSFDFTADDVVLTRIFCERNGNKFGTVNAFHQRNHGRRAQENGFKAFNCMVVIEGKSYIIRKNFDAWLRWQAVRNRLSA